ncbi:MAG: hypothetical protein Q7S03_04080 [bacterium]|nr:hypothetical protein [bacterium]
MAAKLPTKADGQINDHKSEYFLKEQQAAGKVQLNALRNYLLPILYHVRPNTTTIGY